MNSLTIEDNERLEKFINLEKHRTVLKYYLTPFIKLDIDVLGGINNVNYALLTKDGTLIYIQVNALYKITCLR